MKKLLFIILITSLLFACKKGGYVYKANHMEFTTDHSIYPYNGTKGIATDFFNFSEHDDKAAWERYKKTGSYGRIPADTILVEYFCTTEEWENM